MAAGFIADTASLPLIVSNLVNIVSADLFGLGFTGYASVMVPVDIAAIGATLVTLHLFFRKDIPPAYDLVLLKSPANAIKDPATFRTGWIVLILLLVGFSSSSRLAFRSARLPRQGRSFCLRSLSAVMPSIPAKCCVAHHGRSSSSHWGCTRWSTVCATPG